MSNAVTIKVPARLHLGFLDLNGGAGRRFGSIGLPLSRPETVLTLARARETSAEGPDSERAARYLAQLSAALGLRGTYRLAVEEAIPGHAGLGSGTQIALAVAAALRTLHGMPLDIAADALLLARGGRSGIGIASFHEGGVIVDAGHGGADAPPPVVARLPFPEDWRVLLILDRAAEGLHGEAEIAAFRALPPFPEASAGEICRQTLMGVLPALAERDIEAFGMAVHAIQMIVGSYFAPAQGGVFTSPRVERLARRLAEAGATGIGQSSWGPTGFAFAPSEAAARAIVASACATPEAGVTVKIVAGRNQGAEIIKAGLGLVGSRT